MVYFYVFVEMIKERAKGYNNIDTISRPVPSCVDETRKVLFLFELWFPHILNSCHNVRIKCTQLTHSVWDRLSSSTW